MRARAVGVATVLLALAAPMTAGASPATRPCTDDPSVRCGSVRVPLVRAAPDGGGRTLRVHFRVFSRTDPRLPAP